MNTFISPYLKLFFTCLMWTFSQNIIAQDVDSFMTIFHNVKTADSVRTHLINKEGLEYLIFKNAFNQPDNAISYGNSLLEFSKRKQLKIKMGIAHDIIGTAYFFKGDHRNALDYFLEGLKIKESIPDSVQQKKRVLQASYTNLGELYLKEKDLDNAFIYYSKSLALQEKMNDSYAKASSYNDMGNFYKQKKEYDLAIDYYLKSSTIFKNAGFPLEFQGNLADLGDTNFEKGNLNQSILYYRNNIENTNVKNDLATVKSYIGLSKAYFQQADSIYNITKEVERSKYLEAVKFGKQGIELAQKSGFLEYIEEGSKNLYNLHKALGDTENSLKMHELYFKSRDSLKSLNAEKEILILKYKEEYEKERLINQLAQQKQTNKQTKFIICFNFHLTSNFNYFSYSKKYKSKKI